MTASRTDAPLRTLGLLGGMSWESTALYYAGLNQGVAERMGGLHSAPLLMASVDFARIARQQEEGQWDEAGRDLADLARRLEDAGAEAIALAVNTMHKVAGPVREAVSVPLIDIRRCVADAIAATGAKRAVLLGTNYVAREDYYAGEIARTLDGRVEITTLGQAEQDHVHAAIYGELCRGKVREETRTLVAEAIGRSVREDGVGAVALACTELPMLRLGELLPNVPMADSTSVHVDALVDFIVGDAA